MKFKLLILSSFVKILILSCYGCIMTLEVITGPMFSGKSTELIRAIKREGYAKKKVSLFKPSTDNRYSEDKVVTHDGLSFPTYSVPPTEEGVNKIYEIVKQNTLDVVGIDEIHFFSPEVAIMCEKLADEKVKVIVTGLNLDFRGEPFEIVSRLLPKADNIRHLSAICSVCGNTATRSQRLIDGKPARHDAPTIMVGGKELYEPRCREHHTVLK